jgi:hypothetical protein
MTASPLHQTGGAGFLRAAAMSRGPLAEEHMQQLKPAQIGAKKRLAILVQYRGQSRILCQRSCGHEPPEPAR